MGRNKSKWWPEAADIIRRYPMYKRELDSLTIDYAYAAGSSDGISVQTNHISGGAADVAIAMISDERREYLCRAVAAVEFAISMARTYSSSQARMDYIKARYWSNRYTHEGAAYLAGVAARQASTYNGDFVRCVARKMGFL